MAWKEQVSSIDFGSVCFKNGGHNSGVFNLFDEMSASDLRLPSHVLEVTVHRASYPITEEVLHLVFDPFGEVQHMQVLGGSDHVLAPVVFETKYAAAEAFGELHGQCVYTGCCQLDIKWGLSQECEATMDKSRPNSTATSSPNLLQTSITSTSDREYALDTGIVAATATNTDVPSIFCLDVDSGINQAASVFPLVEAVSEELNFDKLYVEAAASEAQVDASAIGAG